MIEFKLPSLGADMDEGKLISWKVKPGDKSASRSRSPRPTTASSARYFAVVRAFGV